ncbi:MAG: TlpA disulfide reductase family protein [Acidimicrobiia bacterium]|nr:TlpA disulfide reductase family protein [Acidimicrobiia bacterium]
MAEPDTPPDPNQQPQRGRVRWWFPAMFAVSTVAAVIAIVASFQRGNDDVLELEVPDLSSLGSGAPAVDDPAPPFVSPGLNGDGFSLADHLATDGRPIMLNLWASWCGPCRNEMPAISDAVARHPEVLFVGVAVNDAQGDAAKFAEEIGVAYPLVFDEGDVVVDGYRPLGLPATFFIGGNGGIVLRYFGELLPETIDEQLELAFGG